MNDSECIACGISPNFLSGGDGVTGVLKGTNHPFSMVMMNCQQEINLQGEELSNVKILQRYFLIHLVQDRSYTL